MKSERAALWSGRVKAWRASGLSSEEFSKGREFTAGGLRHWAHRLGQKTTPRPAVRLARVVRSRATDRMQGARAMGPAADALSGGALLQIEIGKVRIAVSRGFDRATLAAIVDVLTAGGAE